MSKGRKLLAPLTIDDDHTVVSYDKSPLSGGYWVDMEDDTSHYIAESLFDKSISCIRKRLKDAVTKHIYPQEIEISEQISMLWDIIVSQIYFNKEFLQSDPRIMIVPDQAIRFSLPYIEDDFWIDANSTPYFSTPRRKTVELKEYYWRWYGGRGKFIREYTCNIALIKEANILVANRFHMSNPRMERRIRRQS